MSYNNNLLKWQYLINQIEVVEYFGLDIECENREIWAEEYLQLFESNLNITLPTAYKEFCQVFGTGIFGDWLRIYCPDIEDSNRTINSLKTLIEDKLEMDVTLNLDTTINLLDYAFSFGDTTNSKVFLWDLRTYSITDNSYNIYYISYDDIELGEFLVGRDFFEFVKDFCLGMKSYEVLPEIFRPRIQELRHTFARFSRSKPSLSNDGWKLPLQADVTFNPTYTLESEFDWNPYLECFRHLHLPLDKSYIEPISPPEEIDEQEAETQEALRQNNQYAFFRYLKTLGKHTTSVYSVTFSPDGQIVASGDADSIIKLWKLETKQELYTLTGHADAVTSLIISPDGKTLFSSSADSTIKLWDLETRQELYTLTGHADAVTSLIISPDGKTLFSSCADSTIKLWNLTTKQEIKTLTGHTHSVLCVAISPDGKTLASSSADSTIKLWNLSNNEEICILNANSGFVFNVCFHPSKQILVSVHDEPAEYKSINIWDLSTREVIRTINTYELLVSVKTSPSGDIIVGGGGIYEPCVGLWDINTGKIVTTFRDTPVGLVYHRDLVYTITFSPDGQMLASASRDGTIKLWGIPKPISF